MFLVKEFLNGHSNHFFPPLWQSENRYKTFLIHNMWHKIDFQSIHFTLYFSDKNS